MEASLSDGNVDIMLVILLFQTPMLSPNVVDIISELNDLRKKPLIIVSSGGEFTEVLKKDLEDAGVVCYNFPNNAAKSIKQLVDYYLN